MKMQHLWSPPNSFYSTLFFRKIVSCFSITVSCFSITEQEIIVFFVYNTTLTMLTYLTYLSILCFIWQEIISFVGDTSAF